MRLGVVFSLIFALGFAQEKHLTSDFHLSKDVVKYESVEYKYNAVIKNFEVSETEILEFECTCTKTKKSCEHIGKA